MSRSGVLVDVFSPRGAPVFTDAATSPRTHQSLVDTYTVSGITHTGQSISWAMTSAPSGSAATLTGSTTTTPSFLPDRCGSYLLTATATGSDGQTSTYLVQVRIAGWVLLRSIRPKASGSTALSTSGTVALTCKSGRSVTYTQSGTGTPTTWVHNTSGIVWAGPTGSSVGLRETVADLTSALGVATGTRLLNKMIFASGAKPAVPTGAVALIYPGRPNDTDYAGLGTRSASGTVQDVMGQTDGSTPTYTAISTNAPRQAYAVEWIGGVWRGYHEASVSEGTGLTGMTQATAGWKLVGGATHAAAVRIGSPAVAETDDVVTAQIRIGLSAGSAAGDGCTIQAWETWAYAV